MFLRNAQTTTTFHHIPEPKSVWRKVTQWDYFTKRAMPFVKDQF